MNSGWRWLLGALGALLTVWIISARFLNTIPPLVYDDTVQQYVRAPGSVYHHRSEGWATTHVGRFDINGIPDITRISGPKIAIWGDSFVDAVQVDDADKTAQVLARLLHDAQIDATPFAVGGGGRSVADYYFAMPAYERAVPGIAAHVIVLGSIMDVMPDLDTLCHSRFLSAPPRLEESACTPSATALRFTPWIYALSMEFVYGLYDNTAKASPHLLPRTARAGIARSRAPAVYGTTPAVEEAWDYLLESLKRQARQPVAFLYAPSVPVLVDGAFVSDPNAETALLFAASCARHDVAFIDARPLISAHFRDTKTLASGFFNMPPGEGHFNEAGHRIVAAALFKAIGQGRIHVSSQP